MRPSSWVAAAVLLALSATAQAQDCVSCRSAACPDSVWLPPCSGSAKKEKKAKPPAAAAPAPAPAPAPPPAPACPDGKSITDATAGHCCWPGQVWSGGRCIGVPTACPAGMAPDAQHEKCAPAPCRDGQVRTKDLQCCWRG